MCNKHWIRTESNFLELIHVLLMIITLVNFLMEVLIQTMHTELKKIGIWIQKREMELSWVARLTQTIGKVLELK